MIQFLGEHEVTMDGKGRFSLPVNFRKQLPEGAMEFVVTRGFEKCLNLYPKESWQPLFAKISALNDFNPKVRQFKRDFVNGASPVELDSAGRILLPPSLRSSANLTKDIVLVAVFDKIEIWDAKVYKENLEKFDPEAFSQLAEEVMGGNFNPQNTANI